jgi:hypothetical protein
LNLMLSENPGEFYDSIITFLLYYKLWTAFVQNS